MKRGIDNLNEIFSSMVEGFKFTGDIKKDSYNLLIKHDRFIIAEHTLRVARKAKSLAEKYGIDKDLVETAGFLHDIGGVYLNDERLEVSKSLGLEILPEEEKLPLILHQKISRVMAEKLFGVHNQEILNAISCHTTLKAGATSMDMILFVADKIEWDKQGIPPYIQELEKALSISLQFASFSYIKYQLQNRRNLKVIHPCLIEAYEDLERIILV